MLSESKTLLLRSGIFVGLTSVVTTIIYLTPVPDVDFVTCERPCNELDWPMICRIRITLEVYQTLSGLCGDCPRNTSHCFKKYCITGDGFQRGLLTANRQLPGPAIQVCENDILLVDVVNRVPGQGFGIHWRGQPQKETPVMDGVPMVTQCPIPSSTTFQYKFRASRAGTHLWHAQTGVQLTDGIFGALIVRQSVRRDPQSHLYDVDDLSHVVIINEWSHGFAIQRLLEPGPDGTLEASSLLVNGRGSSEGKKTPLSTFRVSAGKRYRFRLAYAGGGRGCAIVVHLQHHHMKVIALDGHPIAPQDVSRLQLTMGERADVVIATDQPVGSYWLKVDTAEDCRTHRVHGAAVVRYQGSPSDIPASDELSERAENLVDGDVTTVLTTTKVQCGAGDVDRLCLLDVNTPGVLPAELSKQQPDVTLYLSFSFKQFAGDNAEQVLVPQMNNFTFILPSSPLLTQAESMAADLMCSRADELPSHCNGLGVCECVHVIDLPLGAIVEIVLVHKGGRESGHVFHLHGYSFYVVGATAMKSPIPLTLLKDMDRRGVLLKRNLHNPVLKDTLALPRNGIAALRFKADNPGYWLLHNQHVSYWPNGFDVILHVGKDRDVPATPKNFPRCGNWIGPEFFLI